MSLVAFNVMRPAPLRTPAHVQTGGGLRSPRDYIVWVS